MISSDIFKSAFSDDSDNDDLSKFWQEKFTSSALTDRASSSSSLQKSQYAEMNLSNLGLENIPLNYVQTTSTYDPSWVKYLTLRQNQMLIIDPNINVFKRLTALDISENNLFEMASVLLSLKSLKILVAKNNNLEMNSFPKNFGQSFERLQVLNLSGNQLIDLPESLLDLRSLKFLHLGGNRLKNLPCRIGDMISLETLYLGGNQLTEVPATVGKLKNLISLTLCDNQLETLPSSVAFLRNLESLSLHNNKLRTLPVDLIKLRNLQQLSLRSNPLVVRFVRDMSFDPPSLKELAGRLIKVNKVQYNTPNEVPVSLQQYLDSAHQCVNPKCKGVYFEACVEHVKFVDFCGKYRIPLLQYLCSPKCSTKSPAYMHANSHLVSGDHGALSSSSDADADYDNSDGAEDEAAVPSVKMRKVLLG